MMIGSEKNVALGSNVLLLASEKRVEVAFALMVQSDLSIITYGSLWAGILIGWREDDQTVPKEHYTNFCCITYYFR